MKNVRIKIVDPRAKIPTKAYHSAGYDLFPMEKGVIEPGEQVQIKLGFETEFPSGYVAQIDDRGSVGNKACGHMAGVIDADYRGEWIIILHNHGKTAFNYSPDKAVAQVLFMQVESPDWVAVETLGETFRGAGKLGSSDTVAEWPPRTNVPNIDWGR